MTSSDSMVLSSVLTAAREVFGRQVLASDNFFDLGGDSISALELTVRLEELLGMEAELEQLLSSDDMAHFAATVFGSRQSLLVHSDQSS
jgi:acyl carrier protein